MRPNVTQQNPWAQVGIVACALLLPPLALGAALYSMLAAPDEGATHPAGAPVNAQAALPDTPRPAVLNPEQAKAEPGVVEPAVGQSAEEVARKWNQILVQGSPGQAGSGQVTSGQVTSGQVTSGQVTSGQVTSGQVTSDKVTSDKVTSDKVTSDKVTSDKVTSDKVTSDQVNPVQDTSAQAPAGNPRTAGGAPAAADGPLAPSAPKRANHRHSRQHQEEYPLQNWLQRMGILPRSSGGG